MKRAPVWFVVHCGLPPFLKSGKALLLSLPYLLLVLLNHRLIHGPLHSISSSERIEKCGLDRQRCNLPKPLTQLPADADRRDAGKQSGSKVTPRLFNALTLPAFRYRALGGNALNGTSWVAGQVLEVEDNFKVP